MRVSLDDVLALVGSLDDAPGFDTARERFRRFLLQRVTDVATLRSVIDQARSASGSQHVRALQDALVVLGRFLGFATSFGSYEPLAGALRFDGLWRSRHGVAIALDVRGGELPQVPADIDGLRRSLAALPPFSSPDAEARRLGLFIVTPAYGDRGTLDEALAAGDRHADIRVVSVGSLLWLVEAARIGRLRYEEIAQVLASAEHPDVAVDLMARASVRAAHALRSAS